MFTKKVRSNDDRMTKSNSNSCTKCHRRLGAVKACMAWDQCSSSSNEQGNALQRASGAWIPTVGFGTQLVPWYKCIEADCRPVVIVTGADRSTSWYRDMESPTGSWREGLHPAPSPPLPHLPPSLHAAYKSHILKMGETRLQKYPDT